MSKYKGTSSDRCQRAPKLTPGNARVLTGSRASQSLCLPFQEQETETGNRTQSNYENIGHGNLQFFTEDSARIKVVQGLHYFYSVYILFFTLCTSFFLHPFFQIDTLSTQIDKLAQARDLLLPRLMSGEIKA
jgi:hypothetical protein